MTLLFLAEAMAPTIEETEAAAGKGAARGTSRCPPGRSIPRESSLAYLFLNCHILQGQRSLQLPAKAVDELHAFISSSRSRVSRQ